MYFLVVRNLPSVLSEVHFFKKCWASFEAQLLCELSLLSSEDEA